MAKSVGIDGGECSVNVVGLDGSYRKTRLLACRVEPLSGGGVEAEKTIEAAGTIATALREGRIKGELVLGHPCDDAVLRKIVRPFSGRDALRKVIKSEAENAIHSHSIDDMVVALKEGIQGLLHFC